MITSPGLDFFRPSVTASLLVVCILYGAASHAVEADARPIPDTLQQRIVACTSCHGVHGEGTPGSGYFPRLAGKPAAYLVRQMQDFQNGLRKYAPMEYTVRQLSPAFMHEIAGYFAAQQVAYRRSPLPPVALLLGWVLSGGAGQPTSTAASEVPATTLHDPALIAPTS